MDALPPILSATTTLFGTEIGSGSFEERALLLAFFLFFGVILLVLIFLLLRK
jgi:hypothetical protein